MRNMNIPNWFVNVLIFLCALGALIVLSNIVKIIIWIFNHITFS